MTTPAFRVPIEFECFSLALSTTHTSAHPTPPHPTPLPTDHISPPPAAFLNLVDFIAIVPFYIEMVVQRNSAATAALFRVIRLIRVFRVFKISRYVSWIRVRACVGSLLCIHCLSVLCSSCTR